MGETLLGRLMIYDALEMSYRTVKIRKDPNGEPITELIDYDYFCGTVSEEATEAVKDSTISVKQLKDMLSQFSGSGSSGASHLDMLKELQALRK